MSEQAIIHLPFNVPAIVIPLALSTCERSAARDLPLLPVRHSERSLRNEESLFLPQIQRKRNLRRNRPSVGFFTSALEPLIPTHTKPVVPFVLSTCEGSAAKNMLCFTPSPWIEIHARTVPEARQRLAQHVRVCVTTHAFVRARLQPCRKCRGRNAASAAEGCFPRLPYRLVSAGSRTAKRAERRRRDTTTPFTS